MARPSRGAFVPGPYGIALDAAGNVYVTTNNNTIEKFGLGRRRPRRFVPAPGINFGMGLAFDRDGNLYAANFVGGTIEKFSPNGTDLGVFANVIGPTGLAFDAARQPLCGKFGKQGRPLRAGRDATRHFRHRQPEQSGRARLRFRRQPLRG
jgi:hypothetical protein